MIQKEYQDKVHELIERFTQLKKWINPEQKNSRIREIEFAMQDGDFWNDHKKAEILMKEMGEVQGLMKSIADIELHCTHISSSPEQNDSLVFETERLIRQLEIKKLFQGTWDKAHAIITISAGAGGQDAADWVHMLFSMYQAYAEHKGWNIHIVDSTEDTFQSKTGRHPLKNITFDVEGDYAFGYLKKESGVHRLVRISPFSSQDLRHTSFALVEVLPQIQEPTLHFKESDLKVEFFRSSGPGGQNVNKVETAVRIVHIPTGIVASSQSQRSQSQNRDKALSIVEAKLIQRMEKERVEQLDQLKTKTKPEWGSQIRSYVLNPYQLVKDHRTEYETGNITSILEKGELDDFIEAELTMQSL